MFIFVSKTQPKAKYSVVHHWKAASAPPPGDSQTTISILRGHKTHFQMVNNINLFGVGVGGLGKGLNLSILFPMGDTFRISTNFVLELPFGRNCVLGPRVHCV